MDDSNLKLVIALAKSYNLLFSHLSHQVSLYDLSITEFGVLEMLYHKGKQPVQKIAEKILVTSGTMTYVIDQLVKKQFVNRQKCMNDKRITYIELTEIGNDKIEFVFGKHVEYLTQLLHSFKDSNKLDLIQSLKAMQKSIHDFEGSDIHDS